MGVPKQSQSQVKKKLNMKTLLVIALFAIAPIAHAQEEDVDPTERADVFSIPPPLVYSTQPKIIHPFYHHLAAPVYAHQEPFSLVYSACKNEVGALVPCVTRCPCRLRRCCNK